jgi:hypothetical protein
LFFRFELRLFELPVDDEVTLRKFRDPPFPRAQQDMGLPPIAQFLGGLDGRDDREDMADRERANMIEDVGDLLRLDVLENIGAANEIRRRRQLGELRDRRVIRARLDPELTERKTKSVLPATIIENIVDRRELCQDLPDGLGPFRAARSIAARGRRATAFARRDTSLR